MKSKGFTLIELMIVVAIIAIIAAIAIPSLLRARMSANEIAAAASCKEFAEAEEIYHRTDYAGVGCLRYAQTLKGDNSLLETVAGSGDLALIDRTFANAEGDPSSAPAKVGYVFTVLTSQGSAVTGNAKSYLINGNMTVGFAFSATPSGYDTSGRNSFMISDNGTVYQKDKGLSAHETVFNPDITWTTAE